MEVHHAIRLFLIDLLVTQGMVLRGIEYQMLFTIARFDGACADARLQFHRITECKNICGTQEYPVQVVIFRPVPDTDAKVSTEGGIAKALKFNAIYNGSFATKI